MNIFCKKIWYCLFVITLELFNVNSFYAQECTSVYKNSDFPVEQRINDLIQRMTLHEKVMQMNQWTMGKNLNPNNVEDKINEFDPEIGSILYRSINPVYRNEIQRKAIEESRLGIPVIFAFDVIHGYRTVFPIPLAQACSWNTELVEQSCEVAAKEAWLSGVNWTFSPMVDVARDPRWGRVSEGYGEDPYVNARFAVAAVKGYQGHDLSEKYTIAACLKHFVGYSMSEGGRDYNYTDVSSQTLWETFMSPFEAGVSVGVATLMSGFNDITGVPATANHYTLTEVLKNKWGHDGFVISDWGSIKNLIDQGVAQDRKQAALKSFKAGVEMDMVDNVYLENMEELVKEKKISEEDINEAVRRILRVKFHLGLFDQPYVDVIKEKDRYLQKRDVDIATEIAAESMVLLKNTPYGNNDNNILPLDTSLKNIAVIGPMVKDSVNIMGFWEGMGKSEDVKSIYESLDEELGKKHRLYYALGCEFDGNDTTLFQQAREACQKSEAVIICLGEKRNWSGENGSRSSLALPYIQEQLVSEIKKLNKPIIIVLSNGRPLELIRLNNLADAIVEIWQPGTYGANALAGILSGRINPSGKLAITFPLTTGQIPIHYNRRPSAVKNQGNYKDIPEQPLYTFGHGLSYTCYEYDTIKLSSSKIKMNGKLYAELKVTNNGTFDGKETILWFISDPVANISRPIKELKYFEKKEIKAGESVVYRFNIDPIRDLSYVDGYGQKHLESGEYYLQVGNQKVQFELED